MRIEKNELPIAFSEDLANALLALSPQTGLKLASIATKLHEIRQATSSKQATLLPYFEDRSNGYKVGAGDWIPVSKKLLEQETTPAGLLLIAAKNVLGPGVQAWSPDTIWIELEDREHLNIPLINRDKLLAAMTLIEVPAFYWEVNTFQNTVMALNDVQSNPERIQEATGAQIAWAVFEAETILHEHQMWEPEFDYEPRMYAAVCLQREGLIMAPEILNFCQPELTRLTKDGAEVSIDVLKVAWSSKPKHDLGETPIDIQLTHLSKIQAYLDARGSAYLDALKSFQ